MLGSGLYASCSFLNLLYFHKNVKTINCGIEDGLAIAPVVINQCDSTGGSDIVQVSQRW